MFVRKLYKYEEFSPTWNCVSLQLQVGENLNNLTWPVKG